MSNLKKKYLFIKKELMAFEIKIKSVASNDRLYHQKFKQFQ